MIMTRTELYNACKEMLDRSGIDDSRFDVMCIFQDVFGDKNPLFRPQELVPEDSRERIMSLTERRSEGYPLQYLLGEWEFYGYPFKVGEGVLIPRPDTETLIEQILDYCRKNGIQSPKIADLCSGSGCIAITLKKELPNAQVTAVEISPQALEYLRENVRLNDTDISIVTGDVFSSELCRSLGSFDIIVSNPPYLTGEDMRELQKEVSCEPALALFGGNDGLGFYRAITQLWKKRLLRGGRIFYEFGMGQHGAVAEILRQNDFIEIELRRDTAGIIRTVSAIYSPDDSPKYRDSTVQV